MTTYVIQTNERKVAGNIISVVCLTPEFSIDKKKETKLDIEHRLYDVFSKYLSAKH